MLAYGARDRDLPLCRDLRLFHHALPAFLEEVTRRPAVVEQMPTRKGRPAGRPFDENAAPRASAFRELEASAGLGLAVLLALDDARVAREEAALLEGRPQLRLVVGQRL